MSDSNKTKTVELPNWIGSPEKNWKFFFNKKMKGYRADFIHKM